MFKKGHAPHNKGDVHVDANYRNTPKKTHDSYSIYDPLNPKIAKMAEGRNSVFSKGVKL